MKVRLSPLSNSWQWYNRGENKEERFEVEFLKVPIFAPTFIEKLAKGPTLRNFNIVRQLDDFREPKDLPTDYKFNKSKDLCPENIDPKSEIPRVDLSTLEPDIPVAWPVPAIHDYFKLSELQPECLQKNHWVMSLRWNEAWVKEESVLFK